MIAPEDQQVAEFIRDNLSRRLSGPDRFIIEDIADGHCRDIGQKLHFDRLAASFADELRNMPKREYGSTVDPELFEEETP